MSYVSCPDTRAPKLLNMAAITCILLDPAPTGRQACEQNCLPSDEKARQTEMFSALLSLHLIWFKNTSIIKTILPHHRHEKHTSLQYKDNFIANKLLKTQNYSYFLCVSRISFSPPDEKSGHRYLSLKIKLFEINKYIK